MSELRERLSLDQTIRASLSCNRAATFVREFETGHVWSEGFWYGLQACGFTEDEADDIIEWARAQPEFEPGLAGAVRRVTGVSL